MEDLKRTQVRRWSQMQNLRCKDSKALEDCSLNHLVRVERITKQTKAIKQKESLGKLNGLLACQCFWMRSCW